MTRKSNEEFQRYQERERAKRMAQQMLSDADIEWRKRVNPALEAKVLKTPLLFTAITMLQRTKPAAACRAILDKPRAKALASRELASLVKLVAKADASSLTEIERSCGRRFEYFAPDEYGSAELLEMVAKALGLDIPRRPELKDFIEAATAAVRQERT